MAVPKQKTSKIQKKECEDLIDPLYLKILYEDKKSGEYRLSHHVDAKNWHVITANKFFKPKI